MLGSPRRVCSGPTRRETLDAGTLSLLGGVTGAGIRGGTIHGASDDRAAFIKDQPVHMAVATSSRPIGQSSLRR